MKKFELPLNTAVFTTKYVMEGLSKIIYVSHDDDGDWQFHGKEENVPDSDIRIIGLGEIIELDESVLEIADLPMGFEAIRNSSDDAWQIVSPN